MRPTALHLHLQVTCPTGQSEKTNGAQTHREIKYKVLLCETQISEPGLVIPNSKSLNRQE